MPPFFPYDRSQSSAPPFSVPPNPSPDSVAAAASYASLGQPLPQDDPRSAQDPIYHPSSYQAQAPSPQMASDGRYLYHHPPPEVAAPYGYGPYPAAPYEPPQFNQNPARPPARSSVSSQSHSPHQSQQPYNHPPPPNYPAAPPYGHPSYPVQPPPQQQPQAQWTGENWQHYNQSFPPAHPPGQEPSYGSGSARPEPSPGQAAEHRAYQAGPSRPESQARRSNERPSRPPEAPPHAKVRKAKEPEPPGVSPPSSSPLGLDFTKLLESYRLVIDNSSALIAADPAVSGPAAAAESVERMLQAALYGVQALDSAATRAASEIPPHPEAERAPEDGEGGAQKARQAEQPPAEGQTCLGCNATSTPEWRRGPMGPRTLCNACGLVYAKLMKKRNREGGRSRASAPAKRGGPAHGNDDSAAASSGDGGSDDEDSYGSQDRRSDGVYQGRD